MADMNEKTQHILYASVTICGLTGRWCRPMETPTVINLHTLHSNNVARLVIGAGIHLVNITRRHSFVSATPSLDWTCIRQPLHGSSAKDKVIYRYGLKTNKARTKYNY